MQFTGLYADPVFQNFFKGRNDTTEYKRGVVSELLNIQLIETNINPVQASLGSGLIRRGSLCGQGALVEADFTTEGYQGVEAMNGMIHVVDDIAHITRAPVDTLQQVITQAWSWIGGFVAPTDTTTNVNTVPTANNSALKRAIIIESL